MTNKLTFFIRCYLSFKFSSSFSKLSSACNNLTWIYLLVNLLDQTTHYDSHPLR